MRRLKNINWYALIVAVLLCQTAGVMGTFFISKDLAVWYDFLVKPPLAPGPWVFGPVWATLYTMLGISLYLVWEKRHSDKRVKAAIALFAVQLVANSLWTFLFFELENMLLALVEISVLLLLIVVVMVKFWVIEKKAALLLVPYFLWVCFATYLNWAFWVLNR